MVGQRISVRSKLRRSGGTLNNWTYPRRSRVCGGDTWSIWMPETIKGFGILTPLQKEFIGILASLPDKDEFYLAGGTALAEYYLGHCLSFDLDFFTGTENLVLPTSYQIENACQKKNLSLKVVNCFSNLYSFFLSRL